MYMKTRRKNFAILIFLSVIVMSILMLFNMLTAQTTIALGDNATPDVYSNFLYYAGKDNFYYADIYYKKLIGANELPSAQIKLKRTRLEDGLWSSISVSSVKISLITPSDTYVATINKNSEEIILFDRTHIYEEGTYTVKASGNISAGASVVQSASFTFVVDKTPPTGTLTGVTNGGYTNSNVSFNWSENGCTATLDGSSYTAGKTISAEGSHTIVLTDKAGNSTTYTFTIDKTPPTGTLTGVTNGGYTNGNVSFNWSENGCTATLDGSSYTAGKTISAEGSHTIVLTDKAGNSTTYTFTIDKTPPTGTLTGVTNGGYTNGNVSFNWSENGCTATLDGSSYTAGKTISAEGSHTIVLTDKAGNSTMYTFTIDKTAPIIDAYNAYTNKSFTLTAKDKFNGVEYWEYRLNSGEILRCDGEALTIGGSISDNGVWEVRVFDFCGNGSAWEIVNHFYRETFGNSDNIRNSYFVPSYFVVTLSQKYYTSCYGSYTFAEYSSAFSFAIQKEWECRVIILDGGSSWNYVTVNNENTRQIYTDINELNSVIDKYARKNIGDRKVMGKNGAVLNNPTDAEGVTRPDALTEQIVELPQLLSDYSSLRFMLAPFSYIDSVCLAFEITRAEFYCGLDENQLTADQTALLELFERVPENKRKIVTDLMQSLAE